MEPKYITFEQAKWIKEKGYEIDTDEVLFYIDEVNNIKEHQLKNRDIVYTSPHHSMKENEYRTYHHWEFIDWLLEKHGIFIEVFANDTEENHNDWIYWYNITMTRKKGEPRIWIDGSPKDSPKEAYSVAFDYIKDNNLI